MHNTHSKLHQKDYNLKLKESIKWQEGKQPKGVIHSYKHLSLTTDFW